MVTPLTICQSGSKLVKCENAPEFQQWGPDLPRLGFTLGGGGVENGTIEFVRQDFLLVFSNKFYRPLTHCLTTVHECDQQMKLNNHPTTSRASLAQYTLFTVVNDAQENST